MEGITNVEIAKMAAVGAATARRFREKIVSVLETNSSKTNEPRINATTPADEIETLIESNRQRVKSVSQIAAEGMELQKVEAERAALRRKAAQNNEAAKAVPQNLGELGESAEHVASALGISAEQWRKLRAVFQKAQSGDAEARELMRALDAGDIFVVRIPSLHAP